MRGPENRQSRILSISHEISRSVEEHLYASKLYEAIEKAKKIPKYSDLTHEPPEEIKKRDGQVKGLKVELFWDLQENCHRTAKIKIDPNGLLRFGWQTQTVLGRSNLRKEDWTGTENHRKVYDRLLRLMSHSPLMAKIEDKSL